ncbi:MAG: DUF4846 domain-containing protein [bacterium]
MEHRHRAGVWLLLVLVLTALPVAANQPLATRIPPPPGCHRVALPADSFGAWLRQLPLKPGRPPVHLYDGTLKAQQHHHHAVIDRDVGRRDLQQCADAIIRLRAEYLLESGRPDEICFAFTSGDLACWQQWRVGFRPSVQGSAVSWHHSATADSSHANFWSYLESVFLYAGSYSLSRELEPLSDWAGLTAGDVFIRGGFPGHAALVVDVAADSQGQMFFLLAQSFMPAQEIHILQAPGEATSPWYPVVDGVSLRTPEWTFEPTELRRFPSAASTR